MANVWSIGIFVEDDCFDLLKDRPAHITTTFNARRIRHRRRHVHTYADPFLFVSGNDLFLLAEVQEVSGKGYINCWRSTDLIDWTDEGNVLKSDYHLSYPFVFESSIGETFMIPESSEAGHLVLYSFTNFPRGLKKVNTILKGPYADANLWQHDGTYYLLAINTKTGEQELFFTDNLYSKTWQPHPANPVSNDPMTNRNGGGFIQRNGRLFRVAQNTSNFYGGGIVILEVLQLDKHDYREQVVLDDYRPLGNFAWQQKGRHHLSLTNFKGKTVIAIDGLQRDTVWNKLINIAFKFYS
jgi:hypothetical protein